MVCEQLEERRKSFRIAFYNHFEPTGAFARDVQSFHIEERDIASINTVLLSIR
jgi:hypothetical protein